MFFFVSACFAEDVKTIKLPKPDTQGGKPLMQALKERKSSRRFSGKEIPLQVLSDMLWAGFGINRPITGGRTAPSPFNIREMEIYVAKVDGLFLYDAQNNALIKVLSKDIRSSTGTQDFVKDAPVDLIYVADLSKSLRAGDKKEFYAAVDTGFISQNVYLFCASEGLSTVVRAWFDEKALSTVMGLDTKKKKIILTQSVGYPG